MVKLKLITKDGRKEVWRGNIMVAYVDPEDDMLCKLDQHGYVATRGPVITHDREIFDALHA